MAINPADAAAAYRQFASGVPKNITGPEPVAGLGGGALPAPEQSFSNLVQNVINESVQAGHAAEKLSVDAAAGRAGLIDVVTALSSAEASLQTVVAVRDRIVSAYQEIMRMPI